MIELETVDQIIGTLIRRLYKPADLLADSLLRRYDLGPERRKELSGDLMLYQVCQEAEVERLQKRMHRAVPAILLRLLAAAACLAGAAESVRLCASGAETAGFSLTATAAVLLTCLGGFALRSAFAYRGSTWQKLLTALLMVPCTDNLADALNPPDEEQDAGQSEKQSEGQTEVQSETQSEKRNEAQTESKNEERRGDPKMAKATRIGNTVIRNPLVGRLYVKLVVRNVLYRMSQKMLSLYRETLELRDKMDDDDTYRFYVQLHKNELASTRQRADIELENAGDRFFKLIVRAYIGRIAAIASLMLAIWLGIAATSPGQSTLFDVQLTAIQAAIGFVVMSFMTVTLTCRSSEHRQSALAFHRTWSQEYLNIMFLEQLTDKIADESNSLSEHPDGEAVAERRDPNEQ